MPQTAQAEQTQSDRPIRLDFGPRRADNDHMNDPRSIIRRVIIGLGLLATFVLTASVFAPDKSQAREFGLIRDPIGTDESPGEASTNPHAGLHSLGSFETAQHIIRAYSTELGPRYSIYDARDHRELGVLMSAEEITRFYPEIQLRGVKFEVPMDGEVDGSTQLMMVDSPEQDDRR